MRRTHRARAALAAAAALLAIAAPGLPAAARPSSTLDPPSASRGAAGQGAPLASAPTTCPAPPAGFVVQAPGTGTGTGTGTTVALTFDDGPGPADLQIAAVLQKHRVPATFFFTGEAVARNPGVARQIAAAGYTIGNHSYDHRYPNAVPGGWSINFVTDQIVRTNAVFAASSGTSSCYFRPPGGITDNVLAAARAIGVTSVMWNVDTNDWRQPNTTTRAATDSIVQAATTVGQEKHPMVLMHSSTTPQVANPTANQAASGHRGNTVAALPQIIAWYRAQGYVFVDLAGRSAP